MKCIAYFLVFTVSISSAVQKLADPEGLYVVVFPSENFAPHAPACSLMVKGLTHIDISCWDYPRIKAVRQ